MFLWPQFYHRTRQLGYLLENTSHSVAKRVHFRGQDFHASFLKCHPRSKTHNQRLRFSSTSLESPRTGTAASSLLRMCLCRLGIRHACQKHPRYPKGAHTCTSPASESASASFTREPGSDIFHHTCMNGFQNFALHFSIHNELIEASCRSSDNTR